MALDRKDYEEPRCICDNSMWVEKKVKPIPADRVISKEDEYLSKNDYDGAEKHLKYWWMEAEEGNDDRGKLLLCNELMGLCRKLGRGDEAREYAQKAIALTKELGLTEMISGATAYLNSGTVYKAFGEPEKSLEYFSKAKEIYEKELPADDTRKAGLYNNMALTMVDLERYAEAKLLYQNALTIMHAAENGEPDEAITYLNMADCAEAELGSIEAEKYIQQCLDKAEQRIDSVPETRWGGYYAFVCEKCAPTFEYYGYFMTAKKLLERSKKIYEGA